MIPEGAGEISEGWKWAKPENMGFPWYIQKQTGELAAG
jgi:hypothetical protein